MSQFISFLAPTATITNYDGSRHASEQTAADIPQTFKDAMTVRERVFVEEQNIALENEFDADDARSFHWVVYASVGATGTTNGFRPGANRDSTSTTSTTAAGADAQEERRRSDPSAHRVAVGTVRLVPPPHPPHPAPSDSHALDNSLAAPATIGAAAANAAANANGTASSNGHSHTTAVAPPYIKLGRLAILSPYRKLGLARLLVRTALDWAAQHPHLLCPPPSPEAVELAKVEGRDGALGRWDGRVLAHAQIHLETFYGSFGFVRDEDMGVWDEEGIDHVGMWLQLKLR